MNANEVLNKLLEDGNCVTKLEIIKLGYGLDKLINDKDWRIRAAVAERGYGLDVLIEDGNKLVRNSARWALENLEKD